MNNQVLTIEQMKELKELGIDTSNASMIWLPVMAIDKATNTPYVDRHDLSIKYSICDAYWRTREGKETYPTFTLQDILEMLPYNVEGAQLNVNLAICCISYENPRIKVCWYNNNILEAAFEMLKWCKINNYI